MRPEYYKYNIHGNEINTFVGVEEREAGWVAFTKHIEAGHFKTKEDAEMVLLKIMFSSKAADGGLKTWDQFDI